LKLIEIIPNYIWNYCVAFIGFFANLAWKVIIEKTLIAVSKLELYKFLFIVPSNTSQIKGRILRYAQRLIQAVPLIFNLAHALLPWLTKLQLFVLNYALDPIGEFR
jgi:hypothetical protein